MVPNVRYYCIPELVNRLCLYHTICIADCFICYLNLLQRLRGSEDPSRKQYVSILFIIPIIVDIHGHRFEVYTLVSKIHENVDIVFGIKNVFELEGVINS